VEHRLTREEGADRDAVQAADQLTVAPRLDAVGPAELVQLHVGVADLPVDPAVGPVRVGAGRDDLLERAVDADLELAAGPPQGLADPQV